MREPLSVTVITQNEERRIAKCLESVSFADEILVVDSGSTDRTVEIARQHGARVIQQSWLGYGRQKQFAVDRAEHDWVLCLDADEWLSEELAEYFKKNNQFDNKCYEFIRRNKFMGKWLRHGEAYPDWSLRFFNRLYGSWSEHSVHERVIPTSDTRVERVRFPIMHDSGISLEQYRGKQIIYGRIARVTAKPQSKTLTSLRFVFSPLLRFVKNFVFRLGFLDGRPGLIHALMGALSSAEKYRKG